MWAAGGEDIQDMQRGRPGRVVDWDADGARHRPGLNSAHYEEMRKRCGAHILFNAFWLINGFCVHQMLMRDSMHQIDLGITLTLIKCILRAFYEVVEQPLNIVGRAAAKLESRFKQILAIRIGQDGQRC